MRTGISTFVTKNLAVIHSLCDEQTSAKARNNILKAASHSIIQAIQELLLNSKHEKLSKAIVALKKKSLNLRNKRKQIITHWKKIRALISPLVNELIDNKNGKE